MTGFLIKVAIYVFAGWFILVSWGALPHFSEGFEEGMRYYGAQAGQILGEFSQAGKRVYEYGRSRAEAMDLFISEEPRRKSMKYWKLTD